MRSVAILGGAILAAGWAFAQQTPAGDDRYRFVPGRSEERTVTLEATPSGARFAWAGARPGWDTALLGVRVAAGAADPAVDVSAGGARLRQHLDPNGRGLRWLNLTGLRGALVDGAAVEIQGQDVAIEPGPATLRTFANGLDLQRRSSSRPRTPTTPRSPPSASTRAATPPS